jgi:glutathione S-transferase
MKKRQNNDNTFRKHSRKELLEILVRQSRQIEQLEAQLREAERKLAQREIILENAGTMAEAALQLNRVFQDADAACQQYLDSVRAAVDRQNSGTCEEADP